MKARPGRFPAILGIGLLATYAAVATAQQPSSTTSTQMGASQTTTSQHIVNATVISVNGNKVVATDAAGKATEYTIPDGFKFQLGGKDIGVADLKPGMHVSATITTTTTTTPVYVTEIKTGKVLAVSGNNIVVRGPQGNRVFSNQDAVQRNAKVMKDGQQVLLSDLRAGDNFTAVIVTDHPPTVVSEREVQAMVHAAPEPVPVAAAPGSAPAAMPTAAGSPEGAPAAPATAPAEASTATTTEMAAAVPTQAPAAAEAPAATTTTDTTATTSHSSTVTVVIVLVVLFLIVMLLLRRRRQP